MEPTEMQRQPQRPPYIVPPRRPMGIFEKIIFLGVQIIVLMIGALIVWGLSSNYESCKNQVTQEISEGWGEVIRLQAPEFIALKDLLSEPECVEVEDVVEVETEEYDELSSDSIATTCIETTSPATSVPTISPTTFNCDAQIQSQTLHRNIYEVSVFTAHVALQATFPKKCLAAIDGGAAIRLSLPSAQITQLSGVEINGKKVDWMQESSYLYAAIDDPDTLPDLIEVKTEFDIRGSHGFYIKAGDGSTITLSGEASDPCFSNSLLPLERKINGTNFEATWKGRNVDASSPSVGVEFLTGVDGFKMVTRSLKYAIFIILLTYVSVLLTELFRKRPIPLFNYFLIGAALIIFYSLLLSFTVHMTFGMAYLISSVMTIALITGYMWMMLKSKKIALTIGGILILTYLCCYILLSLSTYALIMGSLLLFGVLAAMMYSSVKLKLS